MSSFYNGNIKIAIFGESHNSVMGVTIDGLMAGIKIDEQNIKDFLKKRQPKYYDTARVETDNFEIVSGIFNGYTTMAPLTILLKNENVISKDYQSNLIRPGQSDYTLKMKTNGYNDYRGGGHNSGRLTALIVIVGAIFTNILENRGVKIASHIKQIKDIVDRDFTNYEKDFEILNNSDFSSLNKKDEMINAISEAKANNDSLGGIIETVVIGINDFIGEGFFDKVESKIASLVFSIPGVKGIEFGIGFDFANKKGSEVIDELEYVNGEIQINNNYNGGINAGITNKNPIVFRTVFKPTPTISQPIKTIDIENKENVVHTFVGRHDPCIASRSSIIMTSIASIAILDLYISKYGNTMSL